jgi:hypothetical protein
VSETAAQLLLRVIEAFNGSDVFATGRPPPEVRELFVEEPVIVPIRAALEGTRYDGPTALDDWAAALRESWANIRIDVEETREVAPGRVIATGHLQVIGRETGVALNQPFGCVAEVDAGRLATLKIFASETEARKAAAR